MNPRKILSFVSRCIAPYCLAASAGIAQCQSWLPGKGFPGFYGGGGTSAVTLPSGDVVIGGSFSAAGGVAANGIVRWDGFAYHPLGTGVDYYIYDLNVQSNGDVIAVGSFYVAGGVPATSVARWNGTSWSPLGSGLESGAYGHAVTTMPNGDLVVGGFFNSAGGQTVNNVARWNGSSWSPLGSGLNSHVYALATMPNGDLIAGGWFTSAGGTPADYLARWDGANWSPLGSGMDNTVQDLLVLPNGDLIVAGSFTTVAGIQVNGIARWNGTAWSGFGGGCNGSVGTLTLRNGELIAGGSFSSIGGVPANSIARWNGTAWFPLGAGVRSTSATAFVDDMTVRPNGDLVVVGGFASAGGVMTANAARWDGVTWSALTSPGFDGAISAMARTASGGLVVAGSFRNAEGEVASGVALQDGSGWSGLGYCLDSPPGQSPQVTALAGMPNGDIVAGGVFQGSCGASGLARWSWNGTWEPIGGGVSLVPQGFYRGGCSALLVLPNGDLVVGGAFNRAGTVVADNIAVWNGSQWATLGSGVSGPAGPFSPPTNVSCLARLQNGDIVAAGTFTSAGGAPANQIARWDGSAWWPLGSGLGGVSALAVLTNGDLVAAGSFTTAGGLPVANVARWNGSQWAPLGSGLGPIASTRVTSLAALANGDLIAGGNFTLAGGQPANGIARWDGTNWYPLGAGIGGGPAPAVSRLLALTGDHLVVGGDFQTADGQPNAYLARWGCPAPGGGPTFASAIPYGYGCGQGQDKFYETFTALTPPFDLAQSTLFLTYTGVGYQALHVPGAPAWFAPQSAPLPLTDDSVTGSIQLPFACAAPYGPFQQIVVSSNGRIFLGATPGDPSAYYNNVATTLSGSQFCPLYGDFDPATGTGSGTIHVDIDTVNQVVHVTWLDVQVWGVPGSNSSFQVSMSATGDVEYRYGNCQLGGRPALTGGNLGGGQLDPGPIDISAVATFPVYPPQNALVHTAAGRPVLGTAFTLQTSPIPTSSPFGGTLIGWTEYLNGIPLDYLGMPSCRQYASAEVALLFVPSAGQGVHTLTMPNDPAFLGVHLFSQGFAMVPGFNPLGALSSNGIDLRLGNL